MQLLRAQKKAVKKEQLANVELQRRHLSIVLQVQHLLQGLQQDHVRRDLLAGNNQAPMMSAENLHKLSRLATLLGAQRDPRLRWVPQLAWSTTADEPSGPTKPFQGQTALITVLWVREGRIDPDYLAPISILPARGMGHQQWSVYSAAVESSCSKI